MNHDTPSTTTPHTYLFALVDGGGTVPPELGVVRRLVDRGHDVTVLAEDTMAAEVADTGATFRRWDTAPNRPSRQADDDPYRDWECKNPTAAVRSAARSAIHRPGAALCRRCRRRRRRAIGRISSSARCSCRGRWSPPRAPAFRSTCCCRTSICSPQMACLRWVWGCSRREARSAELGIESSRR